jgi:hypothetical protein
MDMDDAIRLNAAGVGIQVFIGGEHETRSVHNMTRLVDAGLRAGIPVMGITAVGKTMVRDAKYFRLACRIIAELGAQYVKTYYVEDDFETVTASCPVRRHGPQHFSIRCAGRHDRRGRRRGAQEYEAEGRLRSVQHPEATGEHRRIANSE